MTYLGYLVAAMGIVLVAFGTFGAARSVLAESGKGFAGASDTVAAMLKEIPALIDSLGRAPKWLAAIIVGVFLVWIGSRMSIPAWPFA